MYSTTHIIKRLFTVSDSKWCEQTRISSRRWTRKRVVEWSESSATSNTDDVSVIKKQNFHRLDVRWAALYLFMIDFFLCVVGQPVSRFHWKDERASSQKRSQQPLTCARDFFTALTQRWSHRRPTFHSIPSDENTTVDLLMSVVFFLAHHQLLLSIGLIVWYR